LQICSVGHYESIFHLVLDPRIKLDYYSSHEWEDNWVEAAKNTVYTIYDENYAPLSGSVYQTSSTIEAEDDADSELFQHIFKKQKLTTNPKHEVDTYLKIETIKHQSGVDTLSWWHVSKKFFYIRITSNSKYSSFSNLIYFRAISEISQI